MDVVSFWYSLLYISAFRLLLISSFFSPTTSPHSERSLLIQSFHQPSLITIIKRKLNHTIITLLTTIHHHHSSTPSPLPPPQQSSNTMSFASWNSFFAYVLDAEAYKNTMYLPMGSWVVTQHLETVSAIL